MAWKPPDNHKVTQVENNPLSHFNRAYDDQSILYRIADLLEALLEETKKLNQYLSK